MAKALGISSSKTWTIIFLVLVILISIALSGFSFLVSHKGAIGLGGVYEGLESAPVQGVVSSKPEAVAGVKTSGSSSVDASGNGAQAQGSFFAGLGKLLGLGGSAKGNVSGNIGPAGVIAGAGAQGQASGYVGPVGASVGAGGNVNAGVTPASYTPGSSSPVKEGGPTNRKNA